MPVIACIGWGSLIWDPRTLPIQRVWFQDGPLVRAEFLRQSKDGRITLVLHKSAKPIRASWAIMDTAKLDTAIAQLADREGTTKKQIGSWTKGSSPPNIVALPDWAEARGVDAAIWTALRFKFDDKTEPPTIAEVLKHLRGLTGEQRDRAERYIRRAPPQTDTDYRRRIENELGWTPSPAT